MMFYVFRCLIEIFAMFLTFGWEGRGCRSWMDLAGLGCFAHQMSQIPRVGSSNSFVALFRVGTPWRPIMPTRTSPLVSVKSRGCFPPWWTLPPFLQEVAPPFQTMYFSDEPLGYTFDWYSRIKTVNKRWNMGQFRISTPPWVDPSDLPWHAASHSYWPSHHTCPRFMMKYQPLAQAKRRPFEESRLGSWFDLLGFVISTSEGALNDQVANPIRQNNDMACFCELLGFLAIVVSSLAGSARTRMT